MNQKIVGQFTIFISVFFLLWFALSRINFTGTETFQEISTKNENRLGEILVKQILLSSKEIENDSIATTLEIIKTRICTDNNISTNINLFVINSEEINAYAFPGSNIVLHSSLIKFCETPEELAAVMAHEIAHIQENHVMKKLSQEVGITLLSTIIGNDYNGKIIREIINMISTNAYSRELETEADAVAVEYLANSNINPENLASFLFHLSRNNHDLPKELEWVSSHPIAKKRAAEILKLSKKHKVVEEPILSESAWNFTQNELSAQ